MTNDELCLECMSNLNLDEIDETKQTITSVSYTHLILRR